MTEPHHETPRASLAHLPLGLFGMVMGLAGTTLATERLARGLPEAVAGAFQIFALAWLAVTVILAIAVFGAYGMKALRYPAAVVGDWHHPVRVNFFPAASIALALIATALLPHAPEVARPVWILGASAHAVGFVAVAASWIGPRPIPIMALNPAWFIPAVGNVVMPIAGVPLGYLSASWLFFGVGITFWLLLLPMVINRLVFEHPLPPPLRPTLAILLAPPAVAFIAYVRLTGGFDNAAHGLYGAALAFAALVLASARTMTQAPFGVPWWALSFPSAAFIIATFVYADSTGSALARGAGVAMWVALMALVALLLVRTAKALASGALLAGEAAHAPPPKAP